MNDTEQMEGQELDRLVAIKVMGWQFIEAKTPKEHPRYSDGEDWFCAEESCVSAGSPPAYSTDIAAAWVVVEKLRESGYYPSLHWGPGAEWTVSFEAGYEPPIFEEETAPLAICRAALAAVGT